MKKRLLSILLTLCIILCIVPTGVFAEGETLKEVKVADEEEILTALADDTVDIITLKNDIAVSSTLIVKRAVTLDIYGYMLEISGSGSVIKIEDGGHLTQKDSDLTYITSLLMPTVCGNGVSAAQRPSAAASSTAARPTTAAVFMWGQAVGSP